jgi:hypothetical protein
MCVTYSLHWAPSSLVRGFERLLRANVLLLRKQQKRNQLKSFVPEASLLKVVDLLPRPPTKRLKWHYKQHSKKSAIASKTTCGLSKDAPKCPNLAANAA